MLGRIKEEIKKREKIIKKLLIVIILISILTPALILSISYYVKQFGSRYIVKFENVPQSQAAIILGAYVNERGQLCSMLRDRVFKGVELYKSGKVKKLLMTGDHGRKSYDEVNNMRIYAESLGVPSEDIFMDHAGFNTYESMYRAEKIFKIESAIVVSQKFHLYRALYLARKFKIDAWGVEAEDENCIDPGYLGAYNTREFFARCKAFVQATTKPEPTFLGPEISIEGDGRKSHD